MNINENNKEKLSVNEQHTESMADVVAAILSGTSDIPAKDTAPPSLKEEEAYTRKTDDAAEPVKKTSSDKATELTGELTRFRLEHEAIIATEAKSDEETDDFEDDEFDSVDESEELPAFLKRARGGKSSFDFFVTVYCLFLAALLAIFTAGVNSFIDIYEDAKPEKVMDSYVEYLSGTKLYNDIVAEIKGNLSEFESELTAAQSAMDKLSIDSEKNYFKVSSSENNILYDVYSGDTHLYTLLLGKKAETGILGISFWEVRDTTFIADSVKGCQKAVNFSAPADAEVYVNGKLLDASYITNDNYRFFIGSVWESEIPESARCVQYTIEEMYGDPEVYAVFDGELLEIYRDEGTDFYHARYPKNWVHNYTIEVPKGASVYVNGVLATNIHSNGTAPDTVFDKGGENTTDIYLIEELFEVPTVTASFGDISLGKPAQNGDKFSFGYIDEMYTKAEITVPLGAAVTVNGILLTEDNATSTAVPFSEWATYGLVIGDYMPTELKTTTNVTMPEFVRYTVGMLYGEPTIEVSMNGAVCEEIYTENSEKLSIHRYDVPAGTENAEITALAEDFAKSYIKYITEGCYGIKDDMELRKNFYENWIKYLSYIVPSSLCYDSALDSYSDVEYRPSNRVVSQSYSVQNIMKYTDDIYFCRIMCTVQDSGDEQPVISIINVMMVRVNGKLMIWSHDTIAA